MAQESNVMNLINNGGLNTEFFVGDTRAKIYLCDTLLYPIEEEESGGTISYPFRLQRIRKNGVVDTINCDVSSSTTLCSGTSVSGSSYQTNNSSISSTTSGVTDIIIGDCITEVGDGAFYSYPNNPWSTVTSVTLSDSVKKIGEKCFRGTACANIDFNKAEIIEDGCIISTLTSVTFNNAVIVGRDFLAYSSISSIKIPNNVKFIGSYFLEGNTTINEIEIPDNVEYMGGYISNKSNNSSSINIDGTWVDNDSSDVFSFGFAGDIKKLTIGTGLKSIGYRWYVMGSGSTGNTHVIIFKSTIPPNIINGMCFSYFKNSSNFYYTLDTLKIYVPDESVDLYKKGTNWSRYSKNIHPISEYVENS